MGFSRISSLASVPLLIAATSFSAFATETYYTDQGHTEVRLGWSHAGVSMQSAEFTSVNGTLVLDPDNVEQSKLDVTVDASSISSGFGPLDDHLKSGKARIFSKLKPIPRSRSRARASSKPAIRRLMSPVT